MSGHFRQYKSLGLKIVYTRQADGRYRVNLLRSRPPMVTSINRPGVYGEADLTPLRPFWDSGLGLLTPQWLQWCLEALTRADARQLSRARRAQSEYLRALASVG